MSTEKVNTGNAGKIIVGVVFAGLLSAVIFLFIQNRNLSNANTDGEVEITQLSTEITTLEKEIENYKVEIEDKDLNLEEKEAELAEKTKQLAEKSKKIEQLLAQNKIGSEKASELRGKIERLEYYLGEQQKEIDRLKNQVASLEGERDTLLGTIGKISDEKDLLADEKRRLGLKVKAAAILKASEFEFWSVKESGKETQESEFKAGRLDQLRISFKTLENVAAEKDTKTYYLAIVDPKGNTIKDASGSGYFTFDEQDKQYTAKDSWGFDGTEQGHSYLFKRQSSYTFEKGTHTVRIYCEGYEIGKASFMVK
jgi:DNA repair exonuclease SbcCD ATPase subunit